MQSLRESRQAKYGILVKRHRYLHVILTQYYYYLQIAARANLGSTTALFEDKVRVTEAEINRLEKKITRIKRKLKEKN